MRPAERGGPYPQQADARGARAPLADAARLLGAQQPPDLRRLEAVGVHHQTHHRIVQQVFEQRLFAGVGVRAVVRRLGCRCVAIA